MKRIAAFATALCLIFSLAACGSAGEENREQEETEKIFTGILQEKKDFMIVVSDEAGSDYLFQLEGETCSASPGSRITITYRGDLADPDSQLHVVRIDPAS